MPTTTKPTQIAGIPIVPYEDFWNDFKWSQSQHITLIGTTGCGKTTLELDLLEMGGREYIIFLGTKAEDETQDELGPMGFKMARDLKDIILDVSHRWVLNPGVTRRQLEDVDKMKARWRKFYQEVLMYCYEK